MSMHTIVGIITCTSVHSYTKVRAYVSVYPCVYVRTMYVHVSMYVSM